MNPQLLFGGLSAARKVIGNAMHRSALGAAAYGVLVCSGSVALGFFTAGCFLYITAIWGAVTASMIIAAAYAIIGGIGFLAIRAVQRRHPLPVVQPLSNPAPDITTSTASRDMPGVWISVGLLAAAGYFMGRSVARKR